MRPLGCMFALGGLGMMIVGTFMLTRGVLAGGVSLAEVWMLPAGLALWSIGRLASRAQGAVATLSARAPTAHDSEADYGLEVVGESKYQSALRSIAGVETEEGHRVACSARLILEDANPYDANAVRVDVSGKTVGYLSRADAVGYREAVNGRRLHAGRDVPAQVVGGWDRGRGDRGHYGVRLALKIPRAR